MAKLSGRELAAHGSQKMGQAGWSSPGSCAEQQSREFMPCAHPENAKMPHSFRGQRKTLSSRFPEEFHSL